MTFHCQCNLECAECGYPNCHSGAFDMRRSAQRAVEENARHSDESLANLLSGLYPKANEAAIQEAIASGFDEQDNEPLQSRPFGWGAPNSIAEWHPERNEMTTKIELPEPAAHMYPSDLEKFQDAETFAQAYSVAVGNPVERSVPLFTLSDMVAYAEACARSGQLMPLMGTPLAIRFDALDEGQAKRNHYQTLAQLKGRGGLGLSEAAAVKERRKYEPMTDALALHILATPNSGAMLGRVPINVKKEDPDLDRDDPMSMPGASPC